MSYQAAAGLYVIFGAVIFAVIGMLMLQFIASYLRRRERERRSVISELRRRQREWTGTELTSIGAREGRVLEEPTAVYREEPAPPRSTRGSADRTARTEELEPELPLGVAHRRRTRRSVRALLRSRE
jgi:hypothetical protein